MKKFKCLTSIVAILLCIAQLFSFVSCDNETAPTETSASIAETTENSTSQTTETVSTVPPETIYEPKTLSGEVEKNMNTYTAKKENTAVTVCKMDGDGTFSVKVRPGGTYRTGLIFGYTKEGDKEIYYMFSFAKEARQATLQKYTNGFGKTVKTNWISGTYGNEVPMKLVFSEGKVYCYFYKTLYFILDEDLSTKEVGYFMQNKNTSFVDGKIDYAAKTPDQVDTLLFGHSYFDFWNSWETDLADTFHEFQLGKGTNVGVGGSKANHWYDMREALVAYQPKTVICMIGINDLSTRTPTDVVKDIENTLCYMKEKLPDLKVVLLSVNHCVYWTSLKSSISQTNNLMKSFSNKHNWIYFADVEYAFCDDGQNPSARWFTDGIHLTDAGYTDVIVPAIEKALRKK